MRTCHEEKSLTWNGLSLSTSSFQTFSQGLSPGLEFQYDDILAVSSFNDYIFLNAGRILAVNDTKVCEDPDDKLSSPGDSFNGHQSNSAHVSQFLPTSRRIVQFSNGKVFLMSFCEDCRA